MTGFDFTIGKGHKGSLKKKISLSFTRNVLGQTFATDCHYFPLAGLEPAFQRFPCLCLPRAETQDVRPHAKHPEVLTPNLNKNLPLQSCVVVFLPLK